MHAGTLSESAQAALAVLGRLPILDHAYLAGGSALALHLGHRKSYDFDFYTRLSLYAEDIATQLRTAGTFEVTLLEPPHTVLGMFNNVKFSLFRYDYPLIGEQQLFQGISVASIADIACMKLTAIGGRATKRDYVDLYVIRQQYTFDKMFAWYREKFGLLGNNLYVILKALQYFEEAEDDDMPEMLTPLAWEEVKKFFTAEALRLAKKYLEPEEEDV